MRSAKTTALVVAKSARAPTATALTVKRGKDGVFREMVDLQGNPFANSEDRRPIHEDAVDGGVYSALLATMRESSGLLKNTSIAYAGDLLRAMKPRDAMERMLVTHALWCHARLAKLNVMLSEATRISDVKTLSELIDRANNDFRKGMATLAEYRRPRTRVTKFIGQQNNAQKQQIVQAGGPNAIKPKKIAVRRVRELPPAEVHARGARGSARSDSANKAVEALNRPTKRRG